MNKLSIVCAFLVLVTTSRAEDAAKEKKSPVEGTWKRVDGAKVVQEVKFTGNKFELTMEEDGQKMAFKGTFKLLPDETPQAIDMTVTESPREEFKGKTSLGIYELKDGKLKWCASHPGGKRRPTEFAEVIGDARFLLVVLEKKK